MFRSKREQKRNGGKATTPDKPRRGKIHVVRGDLVSCKSTLFDGDQPGSYSDDAPARSYGVAVGGVEKGIIRIRFEGEDEIYEIKARDLRIEYGKVTSAKIVVLLMEGNKVAFDHADANKMPRNFFEVLVRSDWRKWVEAVKRELEGWNDNQATTVVGIDEVPKSAKKSFPSANSTL